MEGRMYDHQQQHLLDLQDNSGFGSDPKSWLSGDDLSRTLSSLSAAAASASASGNVDRALFNDLVEMVPLVQSLIVTARIFQFPFCSCRCFFIYLFVIFLMLLTFFVLRNARIGERILHLRDGVLWCILRCLLENLFTGR